MAGAVRLAEKLGLATTASSSCNCGNKFRLNMFSPAIFTGTPNICLRPLWQHAAIQRCSRRLISTSSVLCGLRPSEKAQARPGPNFKMPRGVGYYTESGVPVITVPYQLAHKVERQKFRRESADKIRRSEATQYNIANKLKIIDTKRKQLTHYAGQQCDEKAKLTTDGWTSRKSKGDWFIVNPLRNISSAMHNVESSFEELAGIDPSLIAFLLEKKRFRRPTNIQEQAMAAIRQGENTLLIAETGSGKTYAYLVPLISSMLHERQQNPEEWQNPPTNAPYTLILVPQRDLLRQTYELCQELVDALPSSNDADSSKDSKLQPKLVVRGEHGGIGTQFKLNQPEMGIMDILITTPGMLTKFLSNRIVSLERCRAIVIDECDTLLDDSFNFLTMGILKKVTIRSRAELTAAAASPASLAAGTDADDDAENEKPVGAQLILCGATLPRGLNTTLEDVIVNIEQDLTKITTAHIHRPMQNIRQEFYRMTHPEKVDRLYHMVREDIERHKCCMIFCVKTRTAFYLQKFFTENGMDVPVLTGEMHARRRQDVWEKFRSGDAPAIVCTDIASRGMDTNFVDHVINFEFPYFISDYIHRCGRVGRVSSRPGGKYQGQGRVTSFVTRRGEVSAVQRIERAVRRNLPFHNVNANISRKLNAQQSDQSITPEMTTGTDEGKQEAKDFNMMMPSQESYERRLEQRLGQQESRLFSSTNR